MAFFKMNWVLLLISTCLYPTLMRAQHLDCNFQEVDLLPCLTKTSEITAEACCLALNQALKAGHHCLCALLSYTNPQLASANTLLTTSPLALAFPGCALISPLAACGVPLELNAPPVPTKEPVPTPMATAPPVPTKEPVPTPMATAPLPKPMDLSTNSTQAPTEEPQLLRGMPRASKNLSPLFAYNSYSWSTGARLQIYKSFALFVWIISISAWIL